MGDRSGPRDDSRTRHSRIFVMGDPQAPFAKVMAVLGRHGALGPDGRLAPGVQLVSIGDHFDYDPEDVAGSGQEGLRTLRWLASHDPEQAHLLLGNHDAARVMELAGISDERFAQARRLARSIEETRHAVGREAAERRERAEFLPAFPEVPTYGLAARDYASFTSEQRALVAELLLRGRFHLALHGRLPDGREVLLSHAGVTPRELRLLHINSRPGAGPHRDEAHTPVAIARALNDYLHRAVRHRRDDWEAGRHTPLVLEPLHVPGRAGHEAGGLLYHRPACPERPGADPSWELAPERPRRWDPRELPAGLTQVVGHTGHHKCLLELGDEWPTPAARARPRGGIRTLRADGSRVIYDLGVLPVAVTGTETGPAPAPRSEVIFVDGEMHRVSPDEFALLELESLGR
ncbi:MAG: transcriptional regulator [Polyangia bacterium]